MCLLMSASAAVLAVPLATFLLVQRLLGCEMEDCSVVARTALRSCIALVSLSWSGLMLKWSRVGDWL